MDSQASDRWRRIDAIFAEALEQPPAERPRFLDERCARDPDLRRAVEKLLAASVASDELFGGVQARELPAAGRMLDTYRLLEEIGRGGMGTVYLAERADGQFTQRVAVKLLRHEFSDREAERRFRLERQILARLEHPNIARLLDGGLTAEGQPYFVMEHVIGQPITAYCDRHRLGLEPRLELVRTVCAAVQYAHQNLVVHRDLKPANILVTEDGQVKLLDFGIARVLDVEAFDQSMAVTHTGARLMTPDYAAPEQVRGDAITTATDVYGLGMLLYELLTGQRPYSLASRQLQDIERIVCEQVPPRPSAVVVTPGETAGPADERSGARSLTPRQLRRRLRGDLDNIVLLALRKEPERRYRSVEQLADDIHRYLTSLPVQARGDTILYQAGKFARRHAVGLAAGAAVTLALIAGMFTTTYQARVASLERDRAERVNRFVEDMLGAANPMQGGRGVTVADVLQRAVEEADRTLVDRPSIEAGVRTTLGRTYQNLGLYAEAEPQLRRALALQRSLQGEAHPAVAQAMRDLAELLVERGDYAGPDSLYRRALMVQRRRLGPSHAEVATTLDRLGALSHERGDYAAADSFYGHSLGMRRRLLGDAHADVAQSLTNLGLLRYDQGNFAAAESLGRSALALDRKLYGPDHPHVAFALNNAGRAVQRSGRYREAEQLFEEALALLRRRLGEEHPEVASTLDNLAQLFHELGDYEAAEPLYRQALEMRGRLLGEDHPEVTSSLRNLASLLGDRGDYRGAEPLFREVIAREQRLHRQAHPDAASSLAQLASVLHQRSKTFDWRTTASYQEADSLFRTALVLDRRFRDDPHPVTAYHLAGWADLLADTGRPHDVDSLYREALTDLRATVPAGNPGMLMVQLHWGQFLVREGRLTEAEPLLRGALEGFEAQRGRDSERTFESRIWLGRCMATLGHYDEAESLLEEGYRAAQAYQGARDYTHLALDALVELYIRWNKPRQAATYRGLQKR